MRNSIYRDDLEIENHNVYIDVARVFRRNFFHVYIINAGGRILSSFDVIQIRERIQGSRKSRVIESHFPHNPIHMIISEFGNTKIKLILHNSM